MKKVTELKKEMAERFFNAAMEFDYDGNTTTIMQVKQAKTVLTDTIHDCVAKAVYQFDQSTQLKIDEITVTYDRENYPQFTVEVKINFGI